MEVHIDLLVCTTVNLTHVLFVHSIICLLCLQFRDNIPGPGSYGKGGDPSKLLEEKYSQSPGTVGMLNNGGSTLRTLPTRVSVNTALYSTHSVLCMYI